MPLRRLDCFGCAQVSDFSPLATLAALETLVVPAQFTDLALVQQLTGDFAPSAAGYQRALALFRTIGSEFDEADAQWLDVLPAHPACEAGPGADGTSWLRVGLPELPPPVAVPRVPPET